MDASYPFPPGRVNSFLLMQWILMFVFIVSSCSSLSEDPVLLQREGGVCVGNTDGSAHQQYVNYGVPEVILPCSIPENASTVQWRVNGTLVPILKAASKDGNLVLRNPSFAQEGEYTCHDLATGRRLKRIHLKLGYPPEKPVVRCWSASYPAANCTWSLETETHMPTSFFATYKYGWEGEVYECIQPIPGANSCFIPNIQMFAIDPYVLNVTAVNPLGTATSLFFIFLDEILKPDPPEDVKVSPIQREKKKLLLEWKPPGSWLLPEYFPLKYMVRYWREGSNTNKSTRPTEQTYFVLTGIRSGVKYQVQVAAKDFLDNGEYSAWSTPASGTAWVPE
ncbi:interleukin-27 subunit beta isoform X2 [Sceloporus undulatus]|uniref:interleukin-27 subunit beta isoform X2 n=1 Tax=Sceloporus undulatus TaxID=8520 RepID=UPI001C4B22D7|nr:interleukin-27 subunit beta isoform X2 [Sceloporus undulatus]